jgi:hypothetical protein
MTPKTQVPVTVVTISNIKFPKKTKTIVKAKIEYQKLREQSIQMYGNGYQKGTHIYKAGYGWIPRDDNFESGY